ncbi:uncharacterized protein N7482_002364 [Penicillium canariense]|uniref:Tetratricopeptide-like helical n=1 Tax=Penicillium canariense TaxID=189055 RepID=A0A9W9IHI0_9EURO|nr:uncharacterized protein N7482_002364 [Penicillium canariense]KAJ5176487.1 hypothetical protein N7482_002364 [Penicillium canariense]
MPRPKTFLKESKSKKKSAAKQLPVTADDYLAVGVELEEAGEKWRAGDAAKSMRFFMKAIANYDEGLQKHPGAFDLAYNKARVQYEITQHPKLAAQLSAPQAELLQVALQSHRDALHLEQDNADALFNSGQVLNSLAEVMTDSKHPDGEQLVQASTYLQEAVELFQRCLALQEMKYTEMEEQIMQMESGEMEAPAPEPAQPAEPQPPLQPAESGSGEEAQEQWAAIIEPVTKNTLVDSVVAQLDTLTALCNILTFNPGAGGVGWVQEYSAELIETRLPAYVEGSDRQYEAGLAQAKFICALHDVLYRGGHTDVQTYQQEVGRAFGPELDVSSDPEGLCSKAEALTSLNGALADVPPAEDPETFKLCCAVRWQSLSSALDALAAASKLPSADNLPKIHLARGDAEMQRWRLGRAPWNHAVAQEHGPMLLRNAQTYYRGAAALARRDGEAEAARDGSIKEAIAAAVEGQKTKLDQIKATSLEQVIAVAQDMVEDGMVEGTEMSALIS